MSKLRLIQCGAGGFGDHWLQGHSSQSPDFDLVALVDLSPEILRAAGEKYGIPPERRFQSLEAALNVVEADAVLTVTPPHVHIEHARLAFAKGLHLMTEKPLADTVENAMEMLALAKQAGKQLVVSQQYRFSPPVQTVRHLLQDQRLGAFGHGHLDFYIPADFTGTFREKMEFPLLLDMAIHHLDLIRCVTGLNIETVTAVSTRPDWSWYRHDSALKLLLELEGGIPFSYSGDWSALGRTTSWNGDWRLQCAEGSLHLEQDKVLSATCERWGKNVVVETIEPSPLERIGQAHTLHAFAQAIRTGNPAETSGEDNIKSFAAVVAAMLSAREHRPVSLAEIL